MTTIVSIQINNLILDTGDESEVFEIVDVSSLPNSGLLNIDILNHINSLIDMKDKYLVADIIDNIIADEVSDLTGFCVHAMTYSIL